MTFKSKLLSTVASALLATSANADPDHMIFYVPSSGDEAGISATYAQVAARLGEIEPGERIQVVANPDFTQVFDVSAPADMPDHPAWKRQFLAEATAKLQSYARAAYQSGLGDGATPPNQVGLQEIIAVLPRRASSDVEVVVIGSPRDHRENDQANSTLTRVPNDAFLDLPGHASSFGTGALEGSLNGLRVHVCVIDSGFVDPRQSNLLARYTSLRLGIMGGELATWSVDLDECLSRAKAGRQDGMPTHMRDANATKPTFLSVDNATATPTEDIRSQSALLAEMALPTSVKGTMASKIAAGSLRLVAVKLWDTDGEDGDAVLIKTDDAAIEVKLVNKRQRVVLPVENGNMTMIGLKDGAGGITVGIETDDGKESMTPRMDIGETVIIPFFRQTP